MPYEWVAPEVFLVHKDVTIYRTYKNDHAEEGARDYWYGWSEDCWEGRDSFDVRELPNIQLHDIHTPEGRMAIMRDAIDTSVLTSEGIDLPDDSDAFLTLQISQEDWHLLLETLEKDAESSAFDPELRERIKAALSRIQHLLGIAELVDCVDDVLEWADQTGGWDAPCWQKLRQTAKSVSFRLQPGRSGKNDPALTLQGVYDALYLETDPDGDVYNPDKEWSPDTLDEIADLVRPLFPPLDQS